MSQGQHSEPCQALCLEDGRFRARHPRACLLAARMLAWESRLPADKVPSLPCSTLPRQQGALKYHHNEKRPRCQGTLVVRKCSTRGGGSTARAVDPPLNPCLRQAYVWSADFHVAPVACAAPLLEEAGAAVHAEVDFANCVHYPRFCRQRLKVRGCSGWLGQS